MVRAAIAAAQPGIRAKTQTLRAQLARDPVVMHADAERLRMAFAEVLVNASRFSGDGDVLTLEVAVEDSTAVIVVSDNGAGIAPELLPVIFEGARDAQRGLGIGLRLARAWIKAHGGSIALASSGVGRGTRVEVRLPVAPREVAPATDAARSAASPEKEERVLVADDSAPLRETLAALLESAGYAVRTVPDGYQALQLAALWQPDYVFLDLHMSPLSGFEAAQALRGARTRGVMKLILLSGSDLSADLIEGARRAGFDAWIDKAAIAEQWQGVLHRLRK
jgi:CheY-like chemotaxis protein